MTTESGDGARILIVDDEPEILRALQAVLSRSTYEVVSVSSGEAAIEYLASRGADAVILDLQLPGVSGLEVCRVVREFSSVPILVLSVRDNEADKIAALDLGADDYLTKPFSSGELLARIRVLLRRSPAPAKPVSENIVVGDLEIEPKERRALLRGAPVVLTRMEFDILLALALNADRVVTTSTLLRDVWGEAGMSATRVLRVHVSRLRSKLEDDPASPKRILTEPGVGYRLASSE